MQSLTRSARNQSGRLGPWLLLIALLWPPEAAASDADSTGPPSTTVRGLVVRVVDLDRALDFYRQVAGFELVDDAEGSYPPLLANGDLRLWLVRAARPIEHAYPGTSEAHLTLQVGQLDAALARVVRQGGKALLDQPKSSKVGPSMPIVDPSGNILFLVQRGNPQDPPRIFNFGITVPDMATARRFYEGMLGFRAFSEAYYPPVIPLVPMGAVQLVLHETVEAPSTPPSPDTAQVNLVLEADDLASAKQNLLSEGAVVRATEVSAFGPGFELLDPFGNVHLLVQGGQEKTAGGRQ